MNEIPSPREFDCPYRTCGAKAGQPCKTASGNTYLSDWWHDARYDFRDGFLAGHKRGVADATKAAVAAAEAVEAPQSQRRRRVVPLARTS